MGVEIRKIAIFCGLSADLATTEELGALKPHFRPNYSPLTDA